MCSPHDRDHPEWLLELQRLRHYLQQHGVKAEILGGRLTATDEAAQDGVLVTETIELEPSMAAVRSWLGY